VNYLETDDRQRVSIELGDRGIFDEVAFKRAKLGIVLLITAMVVPMLWMGQKFGEHKLTITATYQGFLWRFLRCQYPWR
jgi:1,4-alpha-glucan branching enzyme